MPKLSEDADCQHLLLGCRLYHNEGRQAGIARGHTALRVVVNLVPVMKVEAHRQRRRRMRGMYEENVCCLIILL